MDSIRAKLKRPLSLLILSVLIVLVIIPHQVSPYYTLLLVSIFFYLILTVNWATFCGPTGYISLGSAAFMGIGIYVMAILGSELPLPLVILLAGLASSLVALIAGFASLRIKGIYFAMFTLGLGECLRHLVNWLEANITHTTGRWVIVVDSTTCYYIMLIILVVALLTSYAIRSSKYGLALRSIGQQEEAAEHMGINVSTLKIRVFTLTAFFMGAAGATMVTQWAYVDASSAFNMFYSFMPALMALFGGIGTVYGWIFGSVFFTLVAELLLTEFPYYYMLIFGVLIMTIVMFLPSGLLETIKKAWQGRMREKYANN